MNTMQEVETKILDTTEEGLLSRIRELGFERYFEGELRAQWLKNPANGEMLRVRQEGDAIMIEHKASAKEAGKGIKSMKETGFDARDFDIGATKTLSLVGLNEEDVQFLKESGLETCNFDTAIEKFGLVGLEKAGLLSVKTRVSHVLDYNDPTEGVRLDFDTYSNLMGRPIPEFLEVEAKYEERVYTVVEALGFTKEDCRNYATKEVFAHYYPNEVNI